MFRDAFANNAQLVDSRTSRDPVVVDEQHWRRIQQTSQVSFKIVFSHGLISLKNNGLLKYYRVHIVFENEHFSTAENDDR